MDDLLAGGGRGAKGGRPERGGDGMEWSAAGEDKMKWCEGREGQSVRGAGQRGQG